MCRSQIQDEKKSDRNTNCWATANSDECDPSMLARGKSSGSTLALPYIEQRDGLMVQDGLAFSSERVVNPKELREAIKQNVHVLYECPDAVVGDNFFVLSFSPENLRSSQRQRKFKNRTISSGDSPMERLKQWLKQPNCYSKNPKTPI